MAHLHVGVARARDGVGWNGGLDPCEVVPRQRQVEGSERLGQPVAPPRADERHDVRPAREHPGDRQRRDRGPLLRGEDAQGLDEREVPLEIAPPRSAG